MRLPKLGIWESALLFAFLNVFDVTFTTYVLSEGGSELNPVVRTFLEHGWSVWQAKLAMLTPVFAMWTRVYTADERKAELLVDAGNWIMGSLVAFELVALVYMHT